VVKGKVRKRFGVITAVEAAKSLARPGPSSFARAVVLSRSRRAT